MTADDDGFCEYFGIMRMTGANPDDLQVLSAKGFVKVFDDKLLLVSDWKENNYIQKDRYQRSRYFAKYKTYLDNTTNALTEGNNDPCIQDVYILDTQERRGEVRLGKDRERGNKKTKKKTKPINQKKYLLEIPKEDIQSLSEYYKANAIQIQDKGESLYEYCESKGKKYTNYKALLQGALRRDYGKRYA